VDSRDQLPYTDCPPTRLRAVRIRRKSQQKNNTNLSHNRANFRIENQKRKRKPGARWEFQKYVRVLFLLVSGTQRVAQV